MLVFQRTVDHLPFKELNALVSRVNSAPWRNRPAKHWQIEGCDFDRVGRKWRVRMFVRELTELPRVAVHLQEGFQAWDLYEAVDFRRITFGRLLKKSQVA